MSTLFFQPKGLRLGPAGIHETSAITKRIGGHIEDPHYFCFTSQAQLEAAQIKIVPGHLLRMAGLSIRQRALFQRQRKKLSYFGGVQRFLFEQSLG